ncbi:hypothetical protein SteCoe_24095 [Stentor coeruleus]|uniref:Uncharacterized protein n=1 Tax=Stentor coeruleus TaxID=5963 RepID=A0A1R2BIF0_9CILI|nr:hypothetical protein SteCoe_24095 [Stentor coeruleus]
MARIAKTEVEISIGNPDLTPKTKVSLNVGTGNTFISEYKERLQNMIGEDPEEMKFYVTIPCPSDQKAQKFASFLNKTLKHANSNPQSMIGMLLRKIQMGGDEEGDASDEEPENRGMPNDDDSDDNEGAPKAFDYNVTTNLNNVIITIEPLIFKDAIEGTLNYVSMQSGEITNLDTNLLIEIDSRRTIHTILSPKMIKMINESTKIKIALSYDPEALVLGRSVAQNFDMKKRFSKILGYASLYDGGSIKINLNSIKDLGDIMESYIEMIVNVASTIEMMIPREVAKVISRLAENTGHEGFISFLTPVFAGEVTLMMRGASRLF